MNVSLNEIKHAQPKFLSVQEKPNTKNCHLLIIHPCTTISLVSKIASNESPNGNPLQYSCLKNPTDGGEWWTTAHRVTQSDTLSNFTSLSSCHS